MENAKMSQREPSPLSRILVLSDIHSAWRMAADIIKEQMDCDAIIFLGDGREKFEMALAECGLDIYGSRPAVYHVSGNCDWGSLEPSVIFPRFSGVKICVTHGHGFGVKAKAGIQSLAEYAAANECGAALFGHTHRPYCEEKCGVQMFNPGAVQNGQYGLLTIENGNISFRHEEM